jgi:hypothetical protein
LLIEVKEKGSEKKQAVKVAGFIVPVLPRWLPRDVSGESVDGEPG